MNLKITKKDWIFLSKKKIVCTRLQKRRARQANAPERLHHHHQQHHQQQQRFASFSRRARKSARFFSAVVRVFSSSSSIGCFCVLFVQTKRDSSSLVRGSGGACLWEREEPNRGTPLVRFPSLTISERAEAGTCAPFRERPSLRERERRTRRIFFPFFSWNLLFEFSLLLSLEQTRRRCRRKEAATRTWKHQQQPNG